MPCHAVERWLADFVLPITQIPAALTDHRSPAMPADNPEEKVTAREIEDPGLPAVIELLRSGTAHDLTSYKPGTLERRIGRRMALAGLKSSDIAGYLTILQADPAELQPLARDLLIHVTEFFRDPAVLNIWRPRSSQISLRHTPPAIRFASGSLVAVRVRRHIRSPCRSWNRSGRLADQ